MKIDIIGVFNVDGEERTGFFIPATIEELKNHKMLFGEDVEIVLSEKAGSSK